MPARSARGNLGFVHVVMGNYGEVGQFYDQALSLNPGYEQALVNKAALFIFQQKKRKP